uniref:ABC transporter domain-containing protein n=1 Tax=Tetradesmus obliquus TaxID=3088 RepID=A0A383VUC5_TETOB|eukprot:jgi/Sobl393_1/9416/SZX69098.1
MIARETLALYADITLPCKSRAARSCRVEEVLSAVGLSAAANTLVGGCLAGGLMLRGLSGGERRRLSIAAGILAAPAVLFVDEPTSGLDSFAALSIMAQLQRIARGGRRVVICTIHQPRSAIWEMVDRVSLLACGRLMYHGGRAGIAPWFASLGYERQHGDESDWLLDLVATGFDKPRQLYGNALMQEQDIKPAAEAFTASYVQAFGRPGHPGSTRQLSSSTSTEGASRPASATPGGLSRLARLGGSLHDLQPAGWQYPTGAGRQLACLLRRNLLGSTRNPFDVAGRILSCTYLGLVFGLVFYNTPADSLSGLRTRLNVCFTATFLIALVPYMTISIYPNDRKVYLADASAKLYRPWTYYLSKVLANFPFSIMGSLCTAWTLYGMAGLRPGWGPVLKAGTLSSLLYLVALQVLHMCSVIAPNQDLTFCLSIIWCVINFALSSFFVNFNEVTTNSWFAQLRYISAIYFTLEGLMVNEFQGSTVDCSPGLETGLASLAESAIDSSSGLYQAVLLQLVQPQPGCIVHNDALLKYMQYSRPFGSSVAILVGYLCVVHGLTFVGMLLLANKEAR